MSKINLILPHQLFENSPLIENDYECYLIEEYLFFSQYKFHKQKIAYHRASMQCYKDYLVKRGKKVVYISAHEKNSDLRKLLSFLKKENIIEIHLIDPTDNWVEKRIAEASSKNEVSIHYYNSPLFLNTKEELLSFFKPKGKKFFQTKFYKQERKKRKILVDSEGNPEGEKWTFDSENRKKYPSKKTPPHIVFPDNNDYYKEAKKYTEEYFSDYPGSLDNYPLYPIDYKTSKKWLQSFFNERFLEFGPYEDAIVKEYSFLNHSVLSPMINTGLLRPEYVISETLKFIRTNDIPINSVEGFVRQIIGWREFIRGIYECKGTQERTTNFWGFKRKIPASFYDGTTGIVPVDNAIKKVLATGYCHHIERLMVLSNFMLLCEFDPDEVYRWFMELFIDAYDWVMVPNVYGMSQFADGGLMATKPYISGSNYIMKMSNYKKGDWQVIWDGLFWRFMHVHRAFFLKNPRLGMLISNFDKMDSIKRNGHLTSAEDYLSSLN